VRTSYYRYIYLVNSKNPTTKIAADEKEIESGARNVIKKHSKVCWCENSNQYWENKSGEFVDGVQIKEGNCLKESEIVRNRKKDALELSNNERKKGGKDERNNKPFRKSFQTDN
jgi:hypothetical protein